MALKAFEKEKMEFIFRDGQVVTLQEPTLLQLKSARAKSKDEIEQAKSLLIDMSMGEIDADFLESLPIAEFNRLAKVVTDFIGLDEKN